MFKVVLLGAGSHSQGNHLPALARYVALHPGRVELAGLCDLRYEHAVAIAARYGFARAYADLDEMLAEEAPDACIAVTPIAATAGVATRVMQAGVPLLMEKPPGASAEEACVLADLAARTRAQVMVSMNRRFDPALRAALEWWGDRPIGYLRATIVRVDRDESFFMSGTAIHPLDAMRAIAGNVWDDDVEVRSVCQVTWFLVRLAFQNGAAGLLEVLPSAGSMAESYEMYGAGRRALIQAAGPGGGTVQCWENGKLAIDEEPARGEPDFVRNGTYGETVAFLDALQEGRPLYPTCADVLQSAELCYSIESMSQRSRPG